MNCLQTYFSLSSLRIVQILAKKKTRKQKHELFAGLLFLFCLLFLILHVFAKNKTRKQEHELFADLLFLFVFSFWFYRYLQKKKNTKQENEIIVCSDLFPVSFLFLWFPISQ
jgi:positive regulator of sigma E activity